MPPIIHASHLSKTFHVYQKQPGMVGTLRSFVKRHTTTKKAVDDISLSINEGELVGFIGPNGAGKTTTLKMLSGLLCPNGGEVKVLGFTPFDRKPDFLRQISLVMGQKNQLWWDLPAMDSFTLSKELYQIESSVFKQRLDDLVSLLDVGSALQTQVRKLSLGQRMKMELIAALLHQPKVLFLDEPTIGLDVVMQQHMREFIKTYNTKTNATIMLTSHYMDDVKELCKRVVMIDQGQVMYDGLLADIIKKYAPNKYVTIQLTKELSREKLETYAPVASYTYPKVVFEVQREAATKLAAKLLGDEIVLDVNIEEPKIEDIIRDVFQPNHI